MTAVIDDYLGIKLSSAESSAIQSFIKIYKIDNHRQCFQTLRDEGFPIRGTKMVKRLQEENPSALPPFIPAKYNVQPEHSDLRIVFDRFVQASLLELEEQLDFCTAVRMFSSVRKYYRSISQGKIDADQIGVRIWKTFLGSWINEPEGDLFTEKVQSRSHGERSYEYDVTAKNISSLLNYPVHPLDAYAILKRFPSDFKADDLNDLQWRNLVNDWQEERGWGSHSGNQDETVSPDTMKQFGDLLYELQALENTIQPNRRNRLEDHQNRKLSDAVHAFRKAIDQLPMPHMVRVELDAEFKAENDRRQKQGKIGVIGKAYFWIQAEATIKVANRFYSRYL